MNKQLKSFLWKIGLFLAAAGVILLLNHFFFNLEAKDIKNWISGFGVWAPFIIICVFAIRPFTLIPLSIIAMATGLLFGPYIGTLYIILGTVLGAASSFIAMKYLLKDVKIEDGDKENLKELKCDLEEHGFKSVLVLRLTPVLNFDLLTFICAKTDVDFKKYIAATCIGTIPGSFMFGFFGSSLLSFKPVNLAVLAGVILLVLVIGYILKRQLDKKYDMQELKNEIKKVKNEG